MKNIYPALLVILSLLLAGCKSAYINIPNDPNQAFEKAKQYENLWKYEQALTIYKHLLEFNHIDATYEVGRYYVEGKGTVTDYSEGIRYLDKAISLGSNQAIFKKAYLYDHGIGVKKNIEIANMLYKLAYQHNIPEGAYNLSHQYLLSGRVAIGRGWLKKASDLGMGLASYNLAATYENDLYKDIKLKKAEEYFLLSYKQGYSKAALGVANLYYRSSKDLEGLLALNKTSEELKSKSYEWMNKAYDAGVPDSTKYLAKYYAEGFGVKKDLAKSHEILQNSEDGSALDELAYRYEEGRYVKQNDLSAEEYYKKAINQNHFESYYYLGKFYKKRARYEEALFNFMRSIEKNVKAEDAEQRINEICEHRPNLCMSN